MESRTAAAVIVCPTLDVVRAATTMHRARLTAGCPAGIVVVSDYERRGALVVGNVILRAALDWGAQHVAYVNDDIRSFSNGWLRRLIEAVEEQSDYGVAVAGSHCRTKPQCTGRPGMEPGIVVCPNPTAWTCAVLKGRMLRQVGELDERFRHYCDDSDFEMRAHAAGWKSVWVQDVWVEHEQGGWDDAWYRQDRAAFRQKWG